MLAVPGDCGLPPSGPRVLADDDAVRASTLTASAATTSRSARVAPLQAIRPAEPRAARSVPVKPLDVDTPATASLTRGPLSSRTA